MFIREQMYHCNTSSDCIFKDFYLAGWADTCLSKDRDYRIDVYLLFTRGA